MGLRNVTAIIHRFDGSGTYTNGKYTDGSTSPITITCSAQPLRPREMEMLPQARRNSEAFKIYSDTEIFTVEAKNPDRVELFGDMYECLSDGRWKNDIIPHFKGIVVKL